MRPSGVTGGVCVTVTLNVSAPVLPAASVDEHVTVVTPTGNFVPDAGTHVTGVTPSTSSNAVTSNVMTMPVESVVVEVIRSGAVSTGAVVSGVTIRPGDPVSMPSAATNAPFTPTTLEVVTT